MNTKIIDTYKRRPRRPPLRRVLSVGMGVTSSKKIRHTEKEHQTNTANLHARAGKRTKSGLRTRARLLGATTREN